METGHQIPRSGIYDIVLRFLYSKIRNKGVDSEASSRMSYTLIYVSLAELVTVCRIGLREPMHLCDCMHRGGGGVRTNCNHYCHTQRAMTVQRINKKLLDTVP